jgi:glycosyltransferase involved in cell wall biosynthesis
MKIAILSYHAGSMINFRGTFIRLAVSKGHTVHALAPNMTDEQKQLILELGAQPVQITLPRSYGTLTGNIAAILRIYSYFRQEKPDALISYFLKPITLSVPIARFCGVRNRIALIEGLGSIFSKQEYKSDTARNKRPHIAKILFKFALAMSTKVLTLNREDATHLEKWQYCKRDQLEVLGPIGVDLSIWKPYPLQKQPLVFMMAARLIREKGILEYIKASTIIKQQKPEIQFILLGDYDDSPYAVTKLEIDSLNNAGAVVMCGHASMNEYLERCHVFVLPSYYGEGVPRVTQEAAACGRAAITTDSVGCRDTVIDGVTGLIIPPRNVEALVSALTYFINNENAVDTMGRAARNFAEQHFDCNVADTRLLETVTRANV